MRSRPSLANALIAGAAVGAIFGLAAIRLTGQAARTAQATRAARTPDGHPNLNGLWQATTSANWDPALCTTDGHQRAPVSGYDGPGSAA